MRTLLFTSSLSLLLAVGGCSKSTPAPATPEPEPAEETEVAEKTETAAADSEPAPVEAGEVNFPNLKVLPKTWTEDELNTYMKKAAAGLGVQCDFCHEFDDMSQETEMKGKARFMMEMTMNIDKEFLGGNGRVGCITCHQGKTEPVTK